MNVMIVGVGGQGTLLASRILGNLVIDLGYDVKVSEVHGMSQRGGSVVTYVKYGEAIYSPIIDKGEADVILAFEMLEAYRALPYLKKDGKIIANIQKMNPMPLITPPIKNIKITDAKPSANELARFAEVRKKSTISQVTEPLKEEILNGHVHTIDEMKAWMGLYKAGTTYNGSSPSGTS